MENRIVSNPKTRGNKDTDCPGEERTLRLINGETGTKKNKSTTTSLVKTINRKKRSKMQPETSSCRSAVAPSTMRKGTRVRTYCERDQELVRTERDPERVGNERVDLGRVNY